ncbi:class I SAM-dependent methyltransferase [Nisaea sp.]|uniref:class I SAM-dependent methyltransferase n=1 Tax=Nisaea sp. TaxID=2024842 RepID=UPI0032EC8E92
MSGIDELKSYYKDFDWHYKGEFWASRWGGSDAQWYCTILPRIAHNLPAPSVLEIGAGPGRLSAYLAGQTDKLILIEIAETAADIAQERFKDDRHVEVYVTDGQSLQPVPDQSISFIFSFYSLVHADPETMEAYVREFGRILSVEGAAFIHHSNAGACATDADTGLPTFNNLQTSAAFVSGLLREEGFDVWTQELFSWEGEPFLTDCFSVFGRPNPSRSARTKIIENWDFAREIERACVMSKTYMK